MQENPQSGSPTMGAAEGLTDEGALSPKDTNQHPGQRFAPRSCRPVGYW
jgi:hypothetical protein